MNELEAANRQFQNDRFATETVGAVIDSVSENGAVCSMEIADKHRNALGSVMGGAIFTLADFAFAVAANHAEDVTVSQTSQITYLGQPKGARVIAEARCVKSGRSTRFYTVYVRDELGTDVAMVTVTGFRKSD